MASEPEFLPENQGELPMNDPGKIRLVLQRLASGFYQRHDVLREVAERILRSP